MSEKTASENRISLAVSRLFQSYTRTPAEKMRIHGSGVSNAKVAWTLPMAISSFDFVPQSKQNYFNIFRSSFDPFHIPPASLMSA